MKAGMHADLSCKCLIAFNNFIDKEHPNHFKSYNAKIITASMEIYCDV